MSLRHRRTGSFKFPQPSLALNLGTLREVAASSEPASFKLPDITGKSSACEDPLHICFKLRTQH
jgi:hypothetical protein